MGRNFSARENCDNVQRRLKVERRCYYIPQEKKFIKGRTEQFSTLKWERRKEQKKKKKSSDNNQKHHPKT